MPDSKVLTQISEVANLGTDLRIIINETCRLLIDFSGAKEALATTMDNDDVLVTSFHGETERNSIDEVVLTSSRFRDWYARSLSKNNNKPTSATFTSICPFDDLASNMGIDTSRPCVVVTLDKFRSFCGVIILTYEHSIENSPFLRETLPIVQSILSGACRRIAVERLQVKESLFRSIVEDATDMIVWSGLDGIVKYVSDSCEEVVEYHPVELVGLSLYDFVFDADRTAAIDFYKSIEDTHRGRRAEFRMRTRSGSIVWVEASVRLVTRSRDSSEDLFITVMRVLTDVKETEAALRESEDRYRALTQVAVEAILSIDSSGQIVDWNPGAEKIFGYSKEEIYGQPLTRLMPERYRDRHIDGLNRFLKTGRRKLIDQTIEIEGMRKGGAVFPIELSISSWKTGDDWFFGGIIRDISERVRAKRALVKQSLRLRRLAARIQETRESERTRLSREVHDQLGQALTGLRMDIAMIESIGGELPEAVADRLDIMKTSIDETVQTVRQIASNLRPGILDDLGIEAAIEWEASEFSKRAGIEVSFKSELANSEVSIHRDRSTTLFRILQELLTNIARHANAKKVIVTLASTKNYISLIVEDDGVGFDTAIRTGEKSLGLLGIEERLALHNGKFEVYSRTGEGTRSVVTIPLIEKHQPGKLT